MRGVSSFPARPLRPPGLCWASPSSARIQVSAAAPDAFNAATRLRSIITILPRPSRLVNAASGCVLAPRPVSSAPREEEGWTFMLRQRRPRRDAPSSRASAVPSHPAPSGLDEQRRASFIRFKKRTEGRCSRCLAPKHHRSSACRDPVRYLSCNLSGHIERSCPLRRASKQRPASPPAAPPPCRSPADSGARSWAEVVASPSAPPPRAGMARASAGIGASDARPEEDSCFIPSSFDMDRDMLEWEQTAAIAWAINAPRRLVALDVDRAIRKQFRLSHGDVAVIPYHPVKFLVKFEHKAQCDVALAAGHMRAADAIVHIRPWRPLERAFGAALNYRVHLCLENVPDYAWTPFVAERIIGRRYSLDRLEDHSVLRTNSVTLDLWAWTADPNLIPKVI
ncbi:uncharacterized protein LOC119285883 [Triticum dicoccoides]|uniref:uncharacterized protein LOC119285883 n=1 Tax=Triticum dicoccoides TaxID=85692 RepID=UPI00188ECC1E|nr:uncharacterized protein LOC119285883 [Triticum dicoccoides]